jgi:hypothetical protein
MTLKEFIQKVLANPSNIQEKYSLGKISDLQAKEIKEKTGLDLSGYERTIENFGLYHAIKHHGNEKKEANRGQKAITPDDFEKIPDIVNKPDDIINLGASKRGGVLLQFIKKIGDIFIYDEEIRTKRKELTIKTMYKRK